MKILLAEDEPQVRAELCEILVSEGYDVVTASDGIEAFEKFRSDQTIELMLLDIRMPRCTGLQTLDAIHKISNDSGRIYETIFITGNNETEAVVHALRLGAFSFLFKPIVVEQLLEELESACDAINQRRYRRFKQETLEAQVESKASQIFRLTQEMQGGLGSATHLLALAAEHYIPEIEFHLHRVGEMSACLAARLGFDKAQLQLIQIASTLHDVGKLKGSPELYNADRPLTDDEFETTKDHALIGGELLGRFDEPLFVMAKNIAEQHHENYDGSGYPNGLSGNQISMEAAIVRVVDVYDNLRAPRPYSTAMPHYRALEIIVNGDEKSNPEQFHPQVLQALLSHHRDIESIYERYRSISE